MLGSMDNDTALFAVTITKVGEKKTLTVSTFRSTPALNFKTDIFYIFVLLKFNYN
jgi:hypothetical protein